MKDFVQLACRTEAPITPEVISRLNKAARLIHAEMGMHTEPGEFTDQLKKWIFYGKEPDWINLLEELGDLFWYVALAIDEIEFITGKIYNFEGVQKMVIAKLQKRYPNKFSEDEALNRDLDAERAELEKYHPGTYLKEGDAADQVKWEKEVKPPGIDLTKPIPPIEHREVSYEEVKKATKTCPRCLGTGQYRYRNKMEECKDCYGTGYLPYNPTPSPEEIESLDMANVGKNEEFYERGSFQYDLTQQYQISQINTGIMPPGTYLILKLDGDTKQAHAARMGARQYSKLMWHEEELNRLSGHINQVLIAEEEKLPPLKRPTDAK